MSSAPSVGGSRTDSRIAGQGLACCLRHKFSWRWINKRELTVLHTEKPGDVLCLAVGVIYQICTPGQTVEKGMEHSCFTFGDSTVMTFFEIVCVQIAPDLLETSRFKCDIKSKVCHRLKIQNLQAAEQRAETGFGASRFS